jgi:isoleucyl-tRNA synthetase
MRAYLTLYRVLEGVCRLAAPVTPMVSELLWVELMGEKRTEHGQPLSVHLTSFPKSEAGLVDVDLEEAMGLVEKIVSLGRAARTRKNLKVRQPLAKMMVAVPGKPGEGAFEKLAPYLSIIRDELNIKEIVEATDLDSLITFSAKLNFKTAGPLLGKDVKTAAAWISQLTSDQVKPFVDSGELVVEALDAKPTLTPEHLEVVRGEKAGVAVESEGSVTVALDTELTPELRDEGFAREIVNKIQNMRKSSGLEVTDNITVRVMSGERLQQAADRHAAFICSETLAQSLEFIETDDLTEPTEWNINGEKASIEVTKA